MSIKNIKLYDFPVNSEACAIFICFYWNTDHYSIDCQIRVFFKIFYGKLSFW